MYKPDQNISNLITSYIKGELTGSQVEELNQWLGESENKQLFDKIVTKERILNKSLEYDAFDMGKAWKNIDQKISKKPNFRKWLSYAAVIVLPLAIGFFILNQVSIPDGELAEIQKIEAGSSNAVIYFANGEVIDLSKDNSDLIRSKENLLVERDSNKLKINDDELLAGKLNKMNRIVTPIGGEYQVELPDGTKVWLNADSYLEFPSKFSGKERRVVAKGELYFDVKSDKNWPFIVESSGMDLKVLGTEFNLRAYSDESEIISTLVEGSVEITNINKEVIRLIPGKQVVLDKVEQLMIERDANIDAVTAWKNGRFIFDNRRVEDIMYDLARWYDVKIFFANSSVKDELFSVNVVRYGDIESILRLLEGTGEVSFDIQGNVITVK